MKFEFKFNDRFSTKALLLLLLIPFSACGQKSQNRLSEAKATVQVFKQTQTAAKPEGTTLSSDTATFAAGCFWCVEAQFSQLKGVEKVVNGFTGGHTTNPDYEAVSTGKTGYAEACNVIFNPSVLSYRELLEAFFVAHDPTQLNRQGNDVGTQYRSAIFYHNNRQKQLAEYYIGKLDAAHVYKRKIVTQVQPFIRFYPASKHHQDYYFKHPEHPYCEYVIQPELKRFKAIFAQKLKSGN